MYLVYFSGSLERSSSIISLHQGRLRVEKLAVLPEQHIEEGLSRAHLQAIAAKAGFNLASPLNDYGVDGQFNEIAIRNGRYYESGFSLHFQLKASTRWSYEDQWLVYDLKAQTYNDLITRNRTPGALPLYLIVLALPPDSNQWLDWSEVELKLAGCCYWAFLKDEPTANQSSVRIRIPRGQTLNPDSLQLLFETLKQGT